MTEEELKTWTDEALTEGLQTLPWSEAELVLREVSRRHKTKRADVCVRVVRTLEYEGPLGWVLTTLDRGAVPADGEHRASPGGAEPLAVIRSSMGRAEVITPREQAEVELHRLAELLGYMVLRDGTRTRRHNA